MGSTWFNLFQLSAWDLGIWFEVQLQRAAKLCGDKVEFIYLDGRTSGSSDISAVLSEVQKFIQKLTQEFVQSDFFAQKAQQGGKETSTEFTS